jgi:NADP-dependent alcohol dehydrogenase
MIGHEITALTGTTHGQTLVLVLPRLMNVMRQQKADKIVQLGERVFGITAGSQEERIDSTIAATKAFFKLLNLATEFEELSIGSDVLDEIVRRFKQRGTLLGENNNIDYAVVEKILKG